MAPPPSADLRRVAAAVPVRPTLLADTRCLLAAHVALLQWVRQTTRESLAAGTTWQLYGQDTVMLDT